MEKEHKERVKEFFKNYPEEKTAILFSDGQIFTEKNDNYAQMFHKQSGLNFKRIQRSEVDLKVKETKKDDDLTKLTKQQLVDFAKEKGLKLDVKDKKDDLLKSINDFIESKTSKSAEDSKQTEEEYKPVNTK